MGIKHDVSYRSGENMAKKTDEELYDVAINMIGSVAKLPVIRVDREAFLRQQFADSKYLDEILKHGPPACVYGGVAAEEGGRGDQEVDESDHSCLLCGRNPRWPCRRCHRRC